MRLKPEGSLYTFHTGSADVGILDLQAAAAAHSGAAGRMGGLYRDHFRVITDCPGGGALGRIRCPAPESELPDAHLLCGMGTGNWYSWRVSGRGGYSAGFALYDVNVRGNAGNYGGLAQYLAINDGRERTAGIWRITV